MFLLTKHDAATRLDVSVRTIDRLIEDGELNPIDIRGCVRLHPDDLQELVERNRRTVRRFAVDTQTHKRTTIRKRQPAAGSFRDRYQRGRS